MERLFQCKNCEHIYHGMVSSCDCNNQKFDYVEMAAFKLPKQRKIVPIERLDISPGHWQRKGNSIFAVDGGKRFIVGKSSSECDDVSKEAAADIANARLMAGSKLMLETLYMAREHFRHNVSRIKNDRDKDMLELVTNAIQYATIELE
jgi:predicted  nucleic acid-binding Zn-ribbon protein